MGLEMESLWDAMKSTHYQRIINKLQQLIQQAHSLDQALVISLDKVVQAVHAEASTFWFYDRFGDGRIRPKAVYGGADLKDFSLAPGEGVAGQVIAAGSSTIIPDCQKDPRWAGKADAATGFRTLTMICVPLYLKQYTFGCIQIINKTDGLPFDDRDLAFTESLAARTSLLFAEQHLLDGYEADDEAIRQKAAQEVGEPSFSALFSPGSFGEVEEELRRLPCISQLSEANQKHVLRLCREIWMILDKNRAQPEKPKRGFWPF